VQRYCAPSKKIPNSDKADGITGKFGDVVAVKCNGATHAFAVTCTTIAKETAVWSGFVSCPETPVNMCPPLIVDHGKASSTSPSKVTEATEIICDHGYKKVGTRAVCSSAGSGKVAWTNIPTCAAVSCIEKKIPNSDKADGITGKVNQKVMVTCNGASEPFAVLCIGIGPEKAIWTGVAPCPVATCPVLSVDNGKASSSSPSKKMEIVDITCDDGYKSVGGTSATCIPSDSTDPMKVEWDQIPRCEALSCPIKKIPNSDKANGIIGKVGETIIVKCESGTPQLLICKGIGPGKAAWTDIQSCPEGGAVMFSRVFDGGAEVAAFMSTYLWTILLFV